MPRINLLPVKAAARQGAARSELLAAAGGLAVLFLVLSYVFSTVSVNVDGYDEKMNAVREELQSLNAKVEEFKRVNLKIADLEKKLQTIEVLKKRKVGPAKVLSDLTEIVTRIRKVWFTNIHEEDGKMVMTGGAMEHEHIAQFQMALERESQFVSDVRLTLVSTKRLPDVEYLEWKIECKTNYSAG